MKAIMEMKPPKNRFGALGGLPTPWGWGEMVQLLNNSTINLSGVCTIIKFEGTIQIGYLLGERTKQNINNNHGIKEAFKTSWSSTNPIFQPDFGVIINWE